MKEVGIIIQARTGSTRLPSKMLLPFYGETGILAVLLSRLERCILADNIIVATTTAVRDDSICELSRSRGLKCYRGNENDVLDRFIQAARHYNIKKIVRICADNPFLDIKALDSLIRTSKNSEADYVSFCTSNKTPVIKTHYGFWAEYVTLATLEHVAQITDDKVYHEHVTNFIYIHPNDFKIILNPIPVDLEKRKIRLTIDTMADFKIQQKIFREVFESNPDFGIPDVISYLDAHAVLYEIGRAHV